MTKNSKKGFTLIELLVALAIFSLFISAVMAIAVSVIKAQRKAYAIQNVQESARYILEIINKEVRTSDIDSVTGDNQAFLNITNSDGDEIDYQFIDTQIQRRINAADWQDLNASNLEIGGSFYIINESFPKRVKVTTVMKVKSPGGKSENEAEINLQSAITPR